MQGLQRLKEEEVSVIPKEICPHRKTIFSRSIAVMETCAVKLWLTTMLDARVYAYQPLGSDRSSRPFSWNQGV